MLPFSNMDAVAGTLLKIGASATGVTVTAIEAEEVAVLEPSAAVAVILKLKLFSNSLLVVNFKVFNCASCAPEIVQSPKPSDVPKLRTAPAGTPEMTTCVTV